MLLFKFKGYDIYRIDGFYGMVKEGDPVPHCGYKYIHAMFQLKGL